MTAARIIYRTAAVCGLIVTLPGFFLERKVSPPPNHPEQFYGFLAVVLAWQAAFWVIGQNPIRFRPLMPVTWVEKFGWLAVTVTLFALHRVDTATLIVGLIDGVLGIGFVVAYLRTPRQAATQPAG